MRIKFIFLITILFILSGSAYSQLFYLQGGMNLANITSTADGDTEDNNMLTSFNAGFMSRFGLSNIIDLETGLIYSGKGSKAETYFNGGNDYVRSKFNPKYLEVPLNLVLKIQKANEPSGIFLHVGPYIAVGVGGKSESETKIGPLISSSSSDIQFSNDDPFTSQQDDAQYDKLKRFDYGIGLGGGIDLNKVILKINYQRGFAKINSTQSNNSVDDKNKFQTLSLSLGIPLSR